MVGDQERAAQRLVLMRMAAPALMPSPHCLDSPPTTCMQLHHRESVVQFINEVCSSQRPRPVVPGPMPPSA